MKVIHLIAGTERREWCEVCMTTAVISFDLNTLSESGVTTIGYYRKCHRCQEDDHAPR